MENKGAHISKHGLGQQGIQNADTVYWNLGAEALYEHTLNAGLATLAKGGGLSRGHRPPYGPFCK